MGANFSWVGHVGDTFPDVLSSNPASSIELMSQLSLASHFIISLTDSVSGGSEILRDIFNLAGLELCRNHLQALSSIRNSLDVSITPAFGLD